MPTRISDIKKISDLESLPFTPINDYLVIIESGNKPYKMTRTGLLANAAKTATTNTFTAGNQIINIDLPNRLGLRIKAAEDQTANLLEIKDSDDTLNLIVTNTGKTLKIGNPNNYLSLGINADNADHFLINPTQSATTTSFDMSISGGAAGTSVTPTRGGHLALRGGPPNGAAEGGIVGICGGTGTTAPAVLGFDPITREQSRIGIASANTLPATRGVARLTNLISLVSETNSGIGYVPVYADYFILATETTSAQTTTVGSSSVPYDGAAWTLSGDINAGGYARTSPTAGNISASLRFTNFGFDIQDDALIVGMIVGFEWYAIGGGLTTGGALWVINNISSPHIFAPTINSDEPGIEEEDVPAGGILQATAPTNAYSPAYFGSAYFVTTDALEELPTVAQINDSNFGFAVFVNADQYRGGGEVRVRDMTADIRYLLPNIPTVASSDALSTSGLSGTWANTGNVYSGSTNDFASVTTSNDNRTEYLTTTGYGIDFHLDGGSSEDEETQVVGFRVAVNWESTGGAVTADDIRIVYRGEKVGLNLAQDEVVPSSGPATTMFGARNFTNGLTFPPRRLTADSFGVAVAVKGDGAVVKVYSVKFYLDYTFCPD